MGTSVEWFENLLNGIAIIEIPSDIFDYLDVQVAQERRNRCDGRNFLLPC